MVIPFFCDLGKSKFWENADMDPIDIETSKGMMRGEDSGTRSHGRRTRNKSNANSEEYSGEKRLIKRKDGFGRGEEWVEVEDA